MLYLDEFCCHSNLISVNDIDVFICVKFVRGDVFRQGLQYCNSIFHFGFANNVRSRSPVLISNVNVGRISYVFPFGFHCVQNECRKWRLDLSVLNRFFQLPFFFFQTSNGDVFL